jgi:integrase
MATLKAIFPHFKADGTARVVVRLTHQRKIKFINTDIYVTKAEVTKAGNIKSLGIQDNIDNVIRVYRKQINDIGLAVDEMTADELLDFLKGKKKAVEVIDFIAYSRDKIAAMERAGRRGPAANYNSAINSLVRFLKREELDINEITASMLRDYEYYLKTTPSAKSKKTVIRMGERGVSLYMGSLRKLINDAKDEFNDEDIDLIRVKCNPFKKYEVPKQAITRKRAIAVEVIRNIIDLEINEASKREVLARDIYLLSFYLVGMNSADLFTCKNYKDGRITYNREKTAERRADNAEISIKVEPEAQPIFERYRDETGERVFDFYKRYASENTFNQALNKGLKIVGARVGVEDLEFYSARHSWATIATNDCGVDKYTVHTALNHADESMRITDIYIKKDFTIIDRANRKVIDYLNEQV